MIDSPQNPRAKLFRSLAESKHRRETGLLALEGRRLVEEALRAGADLAWAAYCPETFTGAEADRLLRGLLDAAVEVVEVSPLALRAMSHTETPPGIAAVARIPQIAPEDVALAERAWLLGVWEVRDPGNLGTMIRTAHALGAAALVAIGECVDFWEPKVLRASAGSALHLPLLRLADAAALAAALAGWQAALVVADQSAPVACDEAGYPRRCLLLVGSEAHGLPEEVLAQAAERVSIPMPGGAESLNAAVAAGIVAFQVSRQGR